ncbi:MAG TPA: hypothetical protein VKV19_19775 [Ktedonobacteraceae bacterium]|jgi:hypothetical protein|nr:hypothetical protein [Ktedonobacteraceae bacterium]
MNSRYPISLKNIPPDAWEMVQAISAKSGAEVAEVLRQCVVTGSLIELIKAGPDDEAGKYGDFSPTYLARLTRRALGAPIDFLLETGEHPYLATLAANANGPTPAAKKEPSGAPTARFLLDQETVNELQSLCMGESFSAGWQPD